MAEDKACIPGCKGVPGIMVVEPACPAQGKPGRLSGVAQGNI